MPLRFSTPKGAKPKGSSKRGFVTTGKEGVAVVVEVVSGSVKIVALAVVAAESVSVVVIVISALQPASTITRAAIIIKRMRLGIKFSKSSIITNSVYQIILYNIIKPMSTLSKANHRIWRKL
jgi:hypothetical protein